MELAVEVHEFCRGLPPVEKFVLADQMRRATQSVCANISEAWRKRRYKPAFFAKLSDAETEAAEMQCWLDMALRLDYMSTLMRDGLDARYERVLSQLIMMIKDADRWCALASSKKCMGVTE